MKKDPSEFLVKLGIYVLVFFLLRFLFGSWVRRRVLDLVAVLVTAMIYKILDR